MEMLKGLMVKEVSLLARFAARQEEVIRLVAKSEWLKLEKILSELRHLSTQIESLEEERNARFCSLRGAAGLGEEGSFLQLVARLQPPTGGELLDLHRKLKIAVIRVKGSCGRLEYFVQSLSDSLTRVLEEILPYRKGKLYQHTGRAKAAAGESIVIDKSY